MMEQAFSEAIRQARKRAGITQKQLADRIALAGGRPMSTQYLNDIERGRRNPPSDLVIVQLAELLSLSADYLYFLAGRLPPDIRGSGANPDTVARGLKKFRRVLEEEAGYES